MTARRRQIVEVIDDSVRRNGYAPSMREIGEAVGLASTSSVSYQLSVLEKEGYLSRAARRPRTATLRAPATPADGTGTGSGPDLAPIPLIGRIAAGGPILAHEQVEDVFPLPRQLVGEGDLIMLRVIGDSMIDAGILSGDYIFVKKQLTASRGEIVVALIGDEATVKYYFPEKDYVRFQPANKTMAPILVRAVDFKPTMLLGVVVGFYELIKTTWRR